MNKHMRAERAERERRDEFVLLVKTAALQNFRSPSVRKNRDEFVPKYKCVRCRKGKPKVSVLMRRPRFLGGQYEADNGYVVCHDCL